MKRIEITISLEVDEAEVPSVIARLCRQSHAYLSLFRSGLPNKQARLEAMTVKDADE